MTPAGSSEFNTRLLPSEERRQGEYLTSLSLKMMGWEFVEGRVHDLYMQTFYLMWLQLSGSKLMTFNDLTDTQPSPIHSSVHLSICPCNSRLNKGMSNLIGFFLSLSLH